MLFGIICTLVGLVLIFGGVFKWYFILAIFATKIGKTEFKNAEITACRVISVIIGIGFACVGIADVMKI